ncbi:MAG: hypothetical protein AABY07_01875 [Nanoarchaeota archaeon]
MNLIELIRVLFWLVLILMGIWLFVTIGLIIFLIFSLIVFVLGVISVIYFYFKRKRLMKRRFRIF